MIKVKRDGMHGMAGTINERTFPPSPTTATLCSLGRGLQRKMTEWKETGRNTTPTVDNCFNILEEEDPRNHLPHLQTLPTREVRSRITGKHDPAIKKLMKFYEELGTL